jgi:hypothetical protein
VRIAAVSTQESSRSTPHFESRPELRFRYGFAAGGLVGTELKDF